MIASGLEKLHRLGYVLVEDVLDRGTLETVRNRVEELYELEGENAGSEFRQEPGARRLANLVDKGEIFQRLIATPGILELVGHVLGPRFKLSSLNARSANPNSWSRQPLHVDMGLLPDEHGYSVCNTVWMLDEFTTDNGALRVVPGSHRWGKRPQEVLKDPEALHDGEILVTAPAGTVVVMNSHLWHGGTENRTAAPRRALHAFYCRRDIPQQQYQKRLIPAEVQARFTPQLRAVLALDDPHNDEISSAMTRASGFLK